MVCLCDKFRTWRLQLLLPCFLIYVDSGCREALFSLHDNLPFCSFSRDLLFHWVQPQQPQHSSNQHLVYFIYQNFIQASIHVSSTKVEGTYVNPWATPLPGDHKAPDKVLGETSQTRQSYKVTLSK